VCVLVTFCLSSGPALASEKNLPFTPPEEGKGKDFSFAVIGDVQGNHKGGLQALVAQIAKDPSIQLIVSPGDISPDHGRSYDRHFLPAILDLSKRIPFFPAAGNHDIHWGSPVSRNGFRNFFDPVFNYLGEGSDNGHLGGPESQRLWYAFVHKGVLFLALDSNLLIDEGKYRKTHALEVYDGLRDEQLRWVEQVLEKYDRDDSIRARFAFFHHSPFISFEIRRLFNLGGHPGHSRMMINQRLPVGSSADYLLDLFRRQRVNAVFTGHEHYYERWIEVVKSGGQVSQSISWVVTGMGGVKPRGRASFKEDQIRGFIDANETIQDYVTRISLRESGLESELVHLHPNETETESRFHNESGRM
jgi:hypothetical protein